MRSASSEPLRSSGMALVDVVVVSYNSRTHLRNAVASLSQLEDVHVIVVDNASDDRSLDVVSDLNVTSIQRTVNGGFAAGCNDGWRAGDAPYVLFLNPDASIDEPSLRALVARLDRDESLGLVAPRIENEDGSLAWSQRRFPRLRSTYARALFLHRVLPGARWTDDLIRDPSAYEASGCPDWVSGACLLVRRSSLETIGGWDDSFFLYGEDIDLCRRLRATGHEILFDPSARAIHLAGQSAPRSGALPLLAASRIAYNRKHRNRIFSTADRIGIALGALTHVVVSSGGTAARVGHARAFGVSLRPRSDRR